MNIGLCFRAPSINTCMPRMQVLRILVVFGSVIAVLALTGCGQGLSGQAIGENLEEIEVLRQEISDISNRVVALDASINNFQALKNNEDIPVMEKNIEEIADSLTELEENIAKFEETIDVIDTSVVDLASLVKSSIQVKSPAVMGDVIGEGGVTNSEMTEDGKSTKGDCNVPGESSLVMTGFEFQSEAETFLKISEPVHSEPGDIIGAIGEYERISPFNDWHYGTISASGEHYLWTNRAGSSWVLYPDFGNNRFGTDSSNPYYNFPSDSPSRYFKIFC